MKKTIITFGILLSFLTVTFAQEAPLTWDGLKKDLEKSDANIKNPKKNVKAKTWKSRADLMYNAYTFNTAGLYVGLPATFQVVQAKKLKNTFVTLDNLYNAPLSKKQTTDGFELWVYPHKKVYLKDGLVSKWEETDHLTENALLKAEEALLKADELDVKKKYRNKKDFQMLAMQIRTNIVNQAIGYYEEKKYAEAYDYLEKGIELGKLPKLDIDTTSTLDVLYYYGGIIGIGAEKYSEARANLNEAIKLNFKPGNCYHLIADSYSKENNDEKYIESIKKGFEKYPEEEILVVDLINYYLGKNQSDKVIEYIDLAIQKNPTNASYYSAKASIYDTKEEKVYEKYGKVMDKVLENKQKAFQNRFDESKKKMYLDKQKEEENKAKALYTEAENHFNKADELFGEALKINSQLFDAAFNRGRLYYKKSERKMAESDMSFKIYKNGPEADKIKAEVNPSLLKAAEYFEIAHKANPKDIDTVKILRTIYYKLKDKANREKYTKILTELNTQ